MLIPLKLNQHEILKCVFVVGKKSLSSESDG